MTSVRGKSEARACLRSVSRTKEADPAILRMVTARAVWHSECGDEVVSARVPVTSVRGLPLISSLERPYA